MSNLERVKQAMIDGEHTDGDLQWAVETIEWLQKKLDFAEAYIDELEPQPPAKLTELETLVRHIYNEDKT